MIKKIIFLLIFIISLNSCGKKAPPEYKEDNNNQARLEIVTKKI
tara:strand:- start:644 stop:775 length:132 start_codon:yes stop_codon:yes gene_type:complete